MNTLKTIALAALATAAMTTASQAASYRFIAYEGGKATQFKRSCSGNWARTNGLARRWEAAGPDRATRLVALPAGQACPTDEIILRVDTGKTKKRKAKRKPYCKEGKVLYRTSAPKPANKN